jgi:hypothetical protein
MAMDVQFTPAEIEQLRETLPDYEPAQKALATLEAEDGNVEASFETLWREKHGTPPQMGNKSLWEVTIQELRKEICGEDDSFRTKVKEYSKNPASAPLLTGLIVYTEDIVASGVTDEVIQEAGEDLSIELGRVLETKIRVSNIRSRLENLQ